MPCAPVAVRRNTSLRVPAGISRRRRATCLAAALTVLLAVFGGCAKRPTPPEADETARRTLPAGEVVGFTGQYGSHVWTGIPYARPPVGELRWRAPQPALAWKDTREAVEFGSPCPQLGSRFAGVTSVRHGTPTGSEDCLYLNVYAPRYSAAEVPSGERRLPVMLWIHGGGNSIGLGDFYNGGNLAATQDVVVVTTNYRLGPLGWLRHAALRADAATEDELSGNFGTLDLIAALRWIRDNISAFGGDPNNVTIFGESAGGRNVVSLLLAPSAANLFHRAIAQSGSATAETTAAAENFSDDPEPGHRGSSNELLVNLLVRDGKAGDRTAAKRQIAAMRAEEISEYLRGKDAYDLLLAYGKEAAENLIDFPNFFADGIVLPAEPPLRRFARKEGYNQVPTIFGTNRDENKLFMFPDRRWVRMFLWVLPRVRDERLYNATADALSAMWKVRGADVPAAAMRGVQGASVYVYRWDWDEEPRMLGADLSVLLGAAHGFEIPFVFGHFDLGPEANRIFTEENEPGRKELSAAMMSYWTQFAYTGDPGSGRSGELPPWTAWDPSSAEAPKFIVLDTTDGGGVRMSSETVTSDSVVAFVDADPRLQTQRERCEVYRELVDGSRGMFDHDDYVTAGKHGCAEYPLEKAAAGG